MEAVYSSNLISNPSAVNDLRNWTAHGVTPVAIVYEKFTKGFLFNNTGDMTQVISYNKAISELTLTATVMRDEHTSTTVVPMFVRLDMTVEVTTTDTAASDSENDSTTTTTTTEYRTVILPCSLGEKPEKSTAKAIFSDNIKVKAASITVMCNLANTIITGLSLKFLPRIESLSDQLDTLDEDMQLADNALDGRLKTAEASLVQVIETANSLTLQVGNLKTGLTKIEQTVDQVKLTAQNTAGDLAELSIKVTKLGSEISLKADLVTIQADYVSIKAIGKAGSVVIHGGNIRANSISVDSINFQAQGVDWNWGYFVTDIHSTDGRYTGYSRSYIKYLGAEKNSKAQ